MILWGLNKEKDGACIKVGSHTGKVSGLCFAPDGRMLVSCSHDWTVQVRRMIPSGVALYILFLAVVVLPPRDDTVSRSNNTALAHSHSRSLLSPDLSLTPWRPGSCGTLSREGKSEVCEDTAVRVQA